LLAVASPALTNPAAPARSPAVVARTLNASGVFGRRYCELLIVHTSTHGPVADVYNTYGYDNCPPRAWNAIDTTAVAHEQNALAVVRNGPRFWLMNRIGKVQHGRRVIKSFGGVRMAMEATLPLTSLNPAPYVVHSVNRATTFSYNAGSTVYELRKPDHTTWVMQSWSRQIDPTLGLGDLKTLGSRLDLPTGWSFRTKRLTKPLNVVTVRSAAHVLQDDLGDTYSELTR
jgi:hypothetical protein